MFIQFNELPLASRVWIYQSDRLFATEELELISAKAINFINSWTRHGDDLKGSFTIKYDRFLILGVDESFNAVSGCSIDASVRFVKELEQELQLDLMNKLNVTFKKEGGIELVSLSDFQDLVKQGEVTAQTVVFNNMLQTKEDFEQRWEVEASQSWHQRFL